MNPRFLRAACVTFVCFTTLAVTPNALAAPNSPIATIEVGGGSFTGYVSRDGDTLAVPVDVRDSSNNSVQGHVAFINAETKTVNAKVAVGAGPIRITPDARESRLYVTNALSGTVSVLNVADRRVTATIDVGGEPVYSAFVPGRNRLLVGTGAEGSIAVIDTRSNTVTDRLALGGNVSTVVLSNDGRFVYATNSVLNRLDVIDTNSLEVIAQVPTGKGPNRAVASPNGRFLLVSNYDADTVTVIDGRSFQVIREISVGSIPIPAVVAPNSRWAWVASAAEDSAMKIDLTNIRTSANPVTRRVATGDEPWMLLMNATGSTLYVANRQTPEISVICTKNGRATTPLATSNPNRWLNAGQAIYTGGASSVVDVLQAAPVRKQRCP